MGVPDTGSTLRGSLSEILFLSSRSSSKPVVFFVTILFLLYTSLSFRQSLLIESIILSRSGNLFEGLGYTLCVISLLPRPRCVSLRVVDNPLLKTPSTPVRGRKPGRNTHRFVRHRPSLTRTGFTSSDVNLQSVHTTLHHSCSVPKGWEKCVVLVVHFVFRDSG